MIVQAADTLKTIISSELGIQAAEKKLDPATLRCISVSTPLNEKSELPPAYAH